MERSIPIPGDLIIVEFSEWYALKDYQKLRVCEHCGWHIVGEDLYVASQAQVSTFRGPANGPPDGEQPMKMSTSGGPFKTVKIRDLNGLKLIGVEEDASWCWQDQPRHMGQLTYRCRVALWQLPVFPDAHYRELKSFGVKTHRDDVDSFEDLKADPAYGPLMELSHGDVRLGCRCCNQVDFDYTFEMPDDWIDIGLNRDLLNHTWPTHLGICPSCQEARRSNGHPVVQHVIDRDCHVLTPNTEVVRHVISRLKNVYETFRAMSKVEREFLIEQAIRHHRRNQQNYFAGFDFPKSEGDGDEKENVPSELSGSDLVSLMRKHRVSPGALAFRLGISKKRVCAKRRSGLQDALTVRDWIEAITGIDPGPIPSLMEIRSRGESITCGFCACPLVYGDTAYSYVVEVFCSIACCRRSRGGVGQEHSLLIHQHWIHREPMIASTRSLQCTPLRPFVFSGPSRCSKSRSPKMESRVFVALYRVDSRIERSAVSPLPRLHHRAVLAIDRFSKSPIPCWSRPSGRKRLSRGEQMGLGMIALKTREEITADVDVKVTEVELIDR